MVLAGCGDDGGRVTETTQTSITSATVTDASASDPSSGTSAAPTSSGGSVTDGSVTDGSATDGVTGSTTAPASTTTDPGTASTGALDDTSTSAATTDDPVKFDAGVLLDIPPPVCLQCALTIASQQSGVLAVAGQHVFATAKLMDKVVYALGTYGAGRFIAAADSSLPFNEQTDCPLSEWLAANGGIQPKILYFGWGPSDGPKSWNVQADAAGIHLPAQYIGKPALLAQDYDIVMYLEGSGQFGDDAPSDQEMTTLLDYIEQGGGMYISSEFYGYLTDDDLTSVNRLLTPLGAPTQPVSLNWGNVDGNIDFECFPEPQ